MHDLDNPIWSSLTAPQGCHHRLAQAGPGWRRYPADHAPFLGVAAADVAVEEALAPGEQRYLLGVLPAVPLGWRSERYAPLAQMVCAQAPTVLEGPEIVPLTGDDRAAVLELTALVYPHYFRPQTMRLGRYYGIWQAGRLAAMIGERLGTGSAREMSAICTHPEFLGRGYARRLTAWLTAQTLAAGSLPFLHVSYANQRAKALYDQLGYRVRLDIEFMALTRPA